jgi:hypothetical protein
MQGPPGGVQFFAPLRDAGATGPELPRMCWRVRRPPSMFSRPRLLRCPMPARRHTLERGQNPFNQRQTAKISASQLIRPPRQVIALLVHPLLRILLLVATPVEKFLSEFGVEVGRCDAGRSLRAIALRVRLETVARRPPFQISRVWRSSSVFR